MQNVANIGPLPQGATLSNRSTTTQRRANIIKHGVTFAQAATVLDDPQELTVFDAAHSQNEERWFTLGLSSEGTLLANAHAYQSKDAGFEQVRIISARTATRRERQQYESEPR